MKSDQRLLKKYKSSTTYLLLALIPYTESNLKFSFTPRIFFSDLAKLEIYSENALRKSYKRLLEKGLIGFDETDGLKRPKITDKGYVKLAPYHSKTLPNSKIMVIFDVPEIERTKRGQIRSLLRELKFEQIQKSVWVSSMDSRQYLKQELKDIGLGSEVLVYECKKL